MTAQPAWVAMTVILAGLYSGASLAWKVCGLMILPMENTQLKAATANARFVAPATLATVHYKKNGQ